MNKLDSRVETRRRRSLACAFLRLLSRNVRAREREREESPCGIETGAITMAQNGQIKRRESSLHGDPFTTITTTTSVVAVVAANAVSFAAFPFYRRIQAANR